MGANAPYGGAFNNVPDRVASAPVIDIGMVSLSNYNSVSRSIPTLEQNLLKVKSFLFNSFLF